MLGYLGLGGPSLTNEQVVSAITAREESVEHAGVGLDRLLDDDYEAANRIFMEREDAVHQTCQATLLFFKAVLSLDEKETTVAKSALSHAIDLTGDAIAESRRWTDQDRMRLPPETFYELQLASALQLSSILGFVSASMQEALTAAWRFKRAYGLVAKLKKHLATCDLDNDAEEPNKHFYALSLVEKNAVAGILFSHGLTSLAISSIPPGIGRILSIIGFSGSRSDALAELRAASRHSGTPYADMALVALMLFYHAINSMCPIVPPRAEAAYHSLFEPALAAAERYPHSILWRLQEIHIAQRQYGEQAALERFERVDTTGYMAQLRVNYLWEYAIALMNALEFRKAADVMAQLERDNNWNKCVYNYTIGVCLLELYFRGETSALGAAEDRLADARRTLGQKKLFGRAVPIETYIGRKLRKLVRPERATVTPVLELILLFNGFQGQSMITRRSSEALIERPGKVSDDPDVALVRSLLKGHVQAFTDRDEARRTLKVASTLHTRILSDVIDAESWVVPAIFYEMACYAWRDGDLDEARLWLQRTEKCGDHDFADLQAIRLAAARDALAQVST
ncbi:Mitochondrial outer membrane protein iml2 [Savitreella phatthalungensis]